MLNLQQMALRQNLQIIVTTHSPVVLDCVPLEGRVFLRRNKQDHDVHVVPPMRDVLQKAMYGQSMDKLSVICEDDISEAIILGVVDALSMKMNFSSDRLSVGRDTGKDEFPNHIRTLGKIGMLSNCIFVLDGDSRDDQSKTMSTATNYGAKILFLPGKSCPEEWIWNEIKQRIQIYKDLLALPELQESIRSIEQEIMGTVNTKTSPFKTCLQSLTAQSQKQPSDIARIVSRQCVEDNVGEIVDFATTLQDEVHKWRTDYT